MAAQTWDSIREAVIVALTQSPSPYADVPPDFEVLFPQGTSYAEGRIYREMTPLCARTQNSSLSTVSGSRTIDLSAMTPLPVLVPEGVALVMPAATLPAAGTRYQYQLTSLDFIDTVWPTEATTLSPVAAEYRGRWWAMRDGGNIVICPTPDAAYRAEITGLFQPEPISATNQTTYLSITYPELFENAVMVFLTGWLERNYGPQSSDPQQSVSHESQYQTLLASAMAQEQRMRGQGTGWTAFTPTPLANPPRT